MHIAQHMGVPNILWIDEKAQSAEKDKKRERKEVFVQVAAREPFESKKHCDRLHRFLAKRRSNNKKEERKEEIQQRRGKEKKERQKLKGKQRKEQEKEHGSVKVNTRNKHSAKITFQIYI